jgi:hypothetical protein
MRDLRRSGPLLLALLLTLLTGAAGGVAAQQAAVRATAVPAPADVFGFQPGDDYKMADYGQMLDYYRRLEAASDRVQMIEIGRSAFGRPMHLLFISSEENLRQLDRWRDIAARLARANDLSEEEARRLAREGKAIVWIDGGMHATERAHAQMTTLLAHRVATEETEEMRRIRDNVIFLLMPVMNPDGLELVVDWYRRQLGTPFETTNPPELYQRYVGHDNNRDWFMILQPETQAVSRVLYHEWYPQIVYNQHQTSPEWTMIWVPPFADPVNPNIPPEVVTGVNLVGQAMHKRFADLGMPGVVSRMQFDMWWNGGMRTAPYYHNMIGILTETAHPSPTPRFYDPDSIPEYVGGRRVGALPTAYPSIFYPDPFKGGWVRFSDAVNYMLEASMAVLNLGADRREDWLYGIYRMGRASIERGTEGGPFAYVVPPDQWDAGEAVELVNVLRRGGVEVHRATAAFQADGRTVPAGSYVMYAAQAFRPHLVDLMERQVYPHREMFPGGPPEPPYDLSGWTLPMQMGVNVVRVERPFTAQTAPVDLAARAQGRVVGTPRFGYLLSGRENASYRAVNRLLREGERVSRATGAVTVGGESRPAGAFVVEGTGARTRQRVERLAQELGLEILALEARPEAPLQRLRQPRIGLYQSSVPNMDEGWTRWVLEQHEVPFDTIRDRDLRSGNLARYTAIILPSDDPRQMLEGHRPGTMPEQFVGGIGPQGTANLRRYVERGGTVVALDAASDFAIEQWGLPVRNVVRDVPSERFFIPGTLIRIRVDPQHPIALGMQEEAAAFFVRSRAFQTEGTGPEVVARYAERDLLMSGWAHGVDEHLAGNAAVVRVPLGSGQVILTGFRTQFRGQPRGTYKLLFNSLLQ